MVSCTGRMKDGRIDRDNRKKAAGRCAFSCQSRERMMPQSPNRTRFTEYFTRENGLEGRFKQWLFHPGMLYGAAEKWWGDGSLRPVPHEGLDFCLYEDYGGEPVFLPGEARIPVMYGGRIIKVFDDFLGTSIAVEHSVIDGGRTLLSIYGHTRPVGDLSVGREVKEGEVIAVVAVPPRRRTPVRPHLHISLLRGGAVLPDQLDWTRIRTSTPGMVNPLDVLDGPYRVIPAPSSDSLR